LSTVLRKTGKCFSRREMRGRGKCEPQDEKGGKKRSAAITLASLRSLCPAYKHKKKRKRD